MESESESDRELAIACKLGRSFFVKKSPEELEKLREEFKQWVEDCDRIIKARDEVINRNDGDAKKEDEMNIIDKEKMLRRRREILTRHFRRRQTAKKNTNSQDWESFTSDSDEEMKIAQEEMKRLMEKAIRETLIEDSKAEAAEKIEDSKAEAVEKIEDSKAEEKMFPRRRGRLIRYVRRRQRSKSRDSSFQIEFHHLQLPSDDSDDEEMNNNQ